MSEDERWRTALDGIAHLRRQVLTALDNLREKEDRRNPDWRAQWSHWQNELIELRDCEADAKQALRALQGQPPGRVAWQNRGLPLAVRLQGRIVEGRSA